MKFLLIVSWIGIGALQAASNSTTTPESLPTGQEPADYDFMNCLEQKENELKNKELVRNAYEKVFGDRDASLIDTYFNPELISHNPMEEDGREPLRAYIQHDKKKIALDIKRISAEGDLVWVHLKVQGHDGVDVAIMDIFRVEDGRIKEHWDVIQPIKDLDKSRNPHPFF